MASEPSSDLKASAAEAEEVAAGIRSRTPAPLVPLCKESFDVTASELHRVAGLLSSTATLMAPVDALKAGVSRTEARVAHTSTGEANRLRVESEEDAAATLILGKAWVALSAEPHALRSAVRWSIEARSLAGPLLTQAAVQRLAHAEVDSTALREALARWEAVLAQLLLQFEEDRRSTIAADLEGRFDDAVDRIARLTDSRGDIEVWIEHLSAAETVRAIGLADALAFCVDLPVRADEIADVLLRSALEATADAELAERSDALGPFRSVDRERLVREFAELDKRVVANAAHRVMERASARRPTAIVGVAAIIANEAQKKKRHMPVGELLRQTEDVAQAVKPCFMMSPYPSVSICLRT